MLSQIQISIYTTKRQTKKNEKHQLVNKKKKINKTKSNKEDPIEESKAKKINWEAVFLGKFKFCVILKVYLQNASFF